MRKSNEPRRYPPPLHPSIVRRGSMSSSNGKTPPRGRGGVFRGSAGGGLLPSTCTTTSNVLLSSSAAALLFDYFRPVPGLILALGAMAFGCHAAAGRVWHCCARAWCARIARRGRSWAAAGGASLCNATVVISTAALSPDTPGGRPSGAHADFPGPLSGTRCSGWCQASRLNRRIS